MRQSVVIGDEKSLSITLKQGVPQGNVLGPVPFTLYMSPLGDLCWAHGMTFHGYADDSQNYLFFQPSVKDSREQCIEVLNNCLQNIRVWMQTYFLKFNDEKKEFIMFGTKQQLSKVPLTSITIGNDPMDSVNQVHNLGYHMDSELRNNIHINKLCQFCYVTLWKLRALQHKIDQTTCQIIVQALVLSKLDYCNSLCIGTANYQLNKLQCIQNMACRIVCNIKKYDSITPHFKKLYWQKILERIIYKVATIMFKCLKGTAPPYLKSLLPVQHSKALRWRNFHKGPCVQKDHFSGTTM